MNDLSQLVIVLYEPQDDINIGSVLRVAENFGVGEVRLVRPLRGDPERILITAPRLSERIASTQHFDTLDQAVGDCVRVYGTTARERVANMASCTPMVAAEERMGFEGKVAFVFGREDSGLPNEALDRCDVLVHIPTNPDYSSLNLAQAVLICVWECARELETEVKEPNQVAARGQVERMLVEAEKALEMVEFFKGPNRPYVMRSVRSVFSRARLDDREVAIWFGIWKEIPAFIRRRLQGTDS